MIIKKIKCTDGKFFNLLKQLEEVSRDNPVPENTLDFGIAVKNFLYQRKIRRFDNVWEFKIS